MGGSIQRNQSTPLSSQQAQDDLFPASSRTQGSFRFGNQSAQTTQPPPSSIDDFPPLNTTSFRNGSGEIGQERSAKLMSTLGFGAQGAAAPGVPGSAPGARAGNGLLNALSANNRASEARSPDAVTPAGTSRSAGGIDEPRQRPPGFREDSVDDSTQGVDPRNPLGAIGSNDTPGKTSDDAEIESPTVHDPLAGMAPIDKWGIKGLRTLMNNYPDYNALITGMDPASFGLDLSSPARISTQIYSLFNDAPPRPAVPEFRLPDCYNVNNVQSLENKMGHFNEETLMWIFYSCPGDIKQFQAAKELNNRNWRWHKKLKVWLTKDEHMQPRPLSAHHEEGYYIIWSTADWRKERRTLTLHYADLETIAPN
jgi:CCR4-NOT transcription complex subunit 2